MTFTIPNTAVAAFADQAEPDSVDLDILVAGYGATGVVTGCAVTAQGTPDMTVAVAAGTIRYAGSEAAVTSGNVTITAAHATLPRKDIVIVSNAGVKSVTAGTAATQPLKPAIPANSLVLAEVYVPAADTAINTNQITDKRVVLPSSSASGKTLWLSGGAAFTGAGTVTFLGGGEPASIAAFSFSATADTYAGYTVLMPSNYGGGNIRVTICINEIGTGGGNARMRVNWSVVETGDLAHEAGTNVDFTVTGTNSVDDAFRKLAAQTITPTGLAAGDLLRLNVARLGADAADTAAGSTRFIGVWLEYDV